MPTNPQHLRPPEFSSREALRYFANAKASAGDKVFCFQVGANDGRINDPVYPYLTRYGWSGLLVEPLTDVFEQELTRTYADFPKVTLANVALAPTEGTLPLYRVAISRSRWATGLSGFRRDNIENHIANGYIARRAAAEGVAMPDNPDDVIEAVDVPTMTVERLLEKHAVTGFDILCVDTEGFDFEILKLVDFGRYRPEFLLFESKNLADDDYVAAKSMLEGAGYRLFWDNGDTFGVLKGSRAETAVDKARSALGGLEIALRDVARRVKRMIR